jgi:tetratricopeptide (TPR) repeat protein
MSMPHNFADDPNSFPGPPTNSSNTTAILVAIAIVCGTLMLICGGVIFGIVTTVRQAQQDFEITMSDQPWQGNNDPTAFREYSGFIASGRYSEAIESVDSALESDPDNAFLHNNKAWILATCPDDTVRNGELAVEHATKACDLTNWSNFAYVDTAAAAYAEAGDFESAVKWQEEAVRLCDDAYKPEFQKRLRLFKAGKAYREGVPPYKEMIDDPTAEEPLLTTEGTDAPANDARETTTTDEQPNP